jgi:hypothetical protein
MRMSDGNWHAIRSVDRPRLRAARLQAHFATQWLARAARAYIPPLPDDGHTNFGWDDARGGLVTHALPDGARLGLRFADLTLMLLAGDAAADTFALNGRRDADVRGWLGRLMAARGLDPDALDAPAPYQLPASRIGSAEPYAAADNAAGPGELAVWYGNANMVLDAARPTIIARNLAAPPVRCWPHHFDLDSLVTVRPGRTMGLGLAPGDDFYDEPYFYVSLYPAPEVASLPQLPAIAHWHAKGFTAAVATAGRIVAARDQKGEVEAYLLFAGGVAIKALS